MEIDRKGTSRGGNCPQGVSFRGELSLGNCAGVIYRSPCQKAPPLFVDGARAFTLALSYEDTLENTFIQLLDTISSSKIDS